MFNERENEEQDREKVKPTDWSGVVIGVLLLPFFFFFMHEGKEDVGLNVFAGLSGILLAIKTRWHLGARPWFWAVIVLMLALNVPLATMIHWPRGWIPGAAPLPIALADFVITIGAVQFAEKVFEKASP